MPADALWRTGLTAAVLLAALAAPLAAATAGQAPAADPRAALFGQLTAAMDRFDQGERWKDADSGILAWSCGQQLRAALYLYQATGDRAWLDRFFKYAEAMFANLTPNRDGFLGWHSKRYAAPAAPDKPGKPGIDFAVHEGIVLTPVCRAIELVKKDSALALVYGPRADKLLATIESQLIPKWDKYRREVAGGAVLVYPDDPDLEAERGITMPHNQYLPIGTVQILLLRITGKAAYRDRATALGGYFKSHLRLVGDHYEWNYWDPAGAWDEALAKTDKPRAEDTGHGSIDLVFVLTAAESGILFTEADLRRFANTFVKVMWNGSLEKPTVGGWVNRPTVSRQSGNVNDWLLLGRLEPKVREVCQVTIPVEGGLAAKAQLYWMWSADRAGKPDAAGAVKPPADK